MIADLRRIGSSELKQEFLLAKKILWQTEGVQNGERLLENLISQPTTGTCPLTVLSTENGKRAAILLDFGSEFSGGVQLVTKIGGVREGLRMHLRFGESAAEAMTPLGVKGTCNDHSIRDMEVILPWNSCSCFGQTGYRFLYLELMEAESYLELVSVQGIFTYRDIPYLGSFSCSDPLLNQIYDTCAYTVHLNMQEMLWDGIKRDRLVWIGDMHPEILAIRTVFGDQKLVDDCLKFISQQHPSPQWPNNMTSYAMWYLLVLRDWFQYNGRKEVLERTSEYWRMLLSRLAELVHEEETEALREDEFAGGFFLDWPTRWQKEAKAGVYALLCIALRAGSELCRLTDNLTDAEEYENKARRLEKEKHSIYDRKQVAAMVYLADQLSDQETADCLKNGGGRGMSTFMSYYILKAAARTAGMETALAMLEEYYGGMLKVGATTFWEDFDLDWVKDGAVLDHIPGEGEYDIHGDNGKYCYNGFRHSLCHGWSSGPAAFLAEETMGIRILEPGCKKMLVAPKLGNLQWAKITYPTPLGILEVFARIENGETLLTIHAPEGMEIIAEKEGNVT